MVGVLLEVMSRASPAARVARPPGAVRVAGAGRFPLVGTLAVVLSRAQVAALHANCPANLGPPSRWRSSPGGAPPSERQPEPARSLTIYRARVWGVS